MKQEFPIRFLIPLGIIACAIAGAFFTAYWQEDAFISFRYAMNLVEGHGLVYNQGEPPLEGYSNFLWTLFSAGIASLSPTIEALPDIAIGFCLLFWGMGLWIWWKIYKTWLGIKCGILALLMVSGNYWVFSTMGTGMETAMQFCWIALATYFSFELRAGSKKEFTPWFIWSLLLAAMLMTRPDAVIPAVWLGGYVLIPRLKKQARSEFPLSALIGVLGGIILIITWLTWKLFYYGELIPNTFYVKGTSGNLWNGILYILAFFIVMGYGAFEVPVILFYRRFSRKIPPFEGLALGIAITWGIYLILIGGDYMSFRLLAPVFPVMILAAMGRFKRMAFPGWMRTALLIAYPILVWGNVVAFGRFIPSGFIQTPEMMRYEMEMPGGIRDIGDAVKALSDDSTLVIATGAAGYLPWVNPQKKIIDMSGLNDREIARNTNEWSGGYLPGHARFADYSYLVDQKVNLVVGRWVYDPQSDPPSDLQIGSDMFNRTVSGFEPGIGASPEILLVEIPGHENSPAYPHIVVVYLEKHPAIEMLRNSRNSKVQFLK